MRLLLLIVTLLLPGAVWASPPVEDRIYALLRAAEKCGFTVDEAAAARLLQTINESTSRMLRSVNEASISLAEAQDEMVMLKAVGGEPGARARRALERTCLILFAQFGEKGSVGAGLVTLPQDHRDSVSDPGGVPPLTE